MFGDLFNGFAGGWGGALLGGGLSYLGARESANAALQGAQSQADALRSNSAASIAAAQPWSVGGLGGTASFDDKSKSLLLGLSPELQNIYQGSLARSGLWGQQATQYGADPFAAADTIYNQQQQYFQPQEDKLRTDMETRLLAQGRLGGTGGQTQARQLEEGILNSQGQRRTQSLSQAQQMINTLLGREAQDLGQARDLLNVPMQQANIGMGIGGQTGAGSAAGLQMSNQAAGLLGQANALSAGGTAMAGLGSAFLRPTQKPA